ncbi:hypothetical protein HMPREF1544_06960 [Mucor circinelloides 1006PhL]|uniref:Uncharacterized protein n=1 Tax=Mucor circinelloides f. circinelloides (strain 1006PhL) TaxID=1220926 RepID=S2JCQ6_MUCC1|nr:hypothetical protein HMPREF1544_06960 [Mucor circinelloides 1006PhL]
MSFNKKSNDDFTNRVNTLLSKDDGSRKETDEELASRFTSVFSSPPIVNQQSYHIPDNVYSDDIDREIEKMLQDSDEEEDAIDDYIYGVLDDKKDMIQEKMDGFQRAFMGQDQFIGTDESDELIKKLQQENALDAKYEQFIHKRDEDLEKRYHALKKDAPSFSNTTYSDSSKPKGSIPKPLTNTDLHDEMDDWCCICNDDATVECLGCEDDNKYCRECFFHTHKSESADYEATKHKSRPYQVKT